MKKLLYILFALFLIGASYRIITGTDDCGETNENKVTTKDKEYKVSDLSWGTGFRFQEITIPKGATITKAKLNIQLKNAFCEARDNCPNTVYGVDEDETSTWDNESNKPSQATKTTEKVNWTITGLSIPWVIHEIDVASIVQEIVDRPGWDKQTLAFVVDTERYGRGNYITVVMSESSDVNSEPPSLEVEWTVASDPTTIYNATFYNATIY